MTVIPDESMDPANPYPISFIIMNTNIIPLHKMTIYVGFCHLVVETPDFHFSEMPPACTKYDTRITQPKWSNRTLTMDERFTITLDDLIPINPPSKLRSADILIIVKYDPWFIPLTREKGFKFATQLKSDGRLQWLSLPLI